MPRNQKNDLAPLEAAVLPPGIRSRHVDGINGLRMHILEAGQAHGDRPLVLLLHGFPELAYSWRKVMQPLAEAGFHVVAPDQRGYGRTTGWDAAYDGDLPSFGMLNLARDAIGLVSALGHRAVAAVVGHDFGSPVAAWCALTRPDVFRSVALMSSPFAGPPSLPFDTDGKPAIAPSPDIHAALTALPRPRKHYQWYFSARAADEDMRRAPQGLHAFLRAYYHMKSADWPGNQPFPLGDWTAEDLSKLPTYYVMDAGKTMAETVAGEMPPSASPWLSDAELAVYAGEFARTGFQGGLQWYRCRTEGVGAGALELFAGRTIDVPATFIAGESDWGVQQFPGALERMRDIVCADMRGCHLIDGAGHWAQQEQPDQVIARLLEFLRR